MADYISREALLALPTETKYDWTDCIDIEDIRNFPAADVEPVRHGGWINRKGGFWDVAQCSVCGTPCPTAGIPPRYCPSCGAKMDLEGKDATL